MESENFTQKELDTILNSLDGISRAEIPAFFYTRLQPRMKKRAAGDGRFWKMLTKPAVSLLTLSLLVVLNIAAIHFFTKSGQTVSPGETSAIQNFANEYDLGITSVYTDKSVQ